jgi:hypothetical protein
MSLSALCFQPPRGQAEASCAGRRSLQNLSCAVCNRSAMGRQCHLQWKVLKCRGKRQGGESNARAMEAMGECNDSNAPARAPLKAKRARSAGLRTRECHSALNAMRRSRRECKRNPIYPRYSGVRDPLALATHWFETMVRDARPRVRPRSSP